MVATAVLRGEERVSLRAILYFFLFLAHLCSIVLSILIYTAPFDISACVLCGCLAHFLLLLSSSFLHSQRKKKLLYHVLGPLSFDKVCLIFDQRAQVLINKFQNKKVKTIFGFLRYLDFLRFCGEYFNFFRFL